MLSFIRSHQKNEAVLKPRPKSKRLLVVNFVPHLSANPKGKMYVEFCRLELLKYRPWHGHPSCAWRPLGTNCSGKPLGLSEHEESQIITVVYKSFMLQYKEGYDERFGRDERNIGLDLDMQAFDLNIDDSARLKRAKHRENLRLTESRSHKVGTGFVICFLKDKVSKPRTLLA